MWSDIKVQDERLQSYIRKMGCCPLSSLLSFMLPDRLQGLGPSSIWQHFTLQVVLGERELTARACLQ